jgi:C4-dicarboxylate-specific signal transduction histidine kinase
MNTNLNQATFNQEQNVKALAHDIRGMLATVQLAIDRLMLHEDKAVRKQCSTVEKIILKATEYCSDTVHDRRVKERQYVSTGQLVKDINLILQPLAQSKTVDYDIIHTDAIIPKHISKKLQRVIVNLGRNSIKAQSDQDRGRLIILIDVSQHEIVIEIIDNGPGIPNDIIEELYEHIGNSTPFAKKKLGMGLTSSYAFIGELDGQISISNTMFRGTKFQIEVPLRREQDIDHLFEVNEVVC